MSIRRMTENVSIISSLPDTPQPPVYNATLIKSKFDEAANKIKTYINDVLIPDMESVSITGVTAVRKLIMSYTASGGYSFNTEEHPSIGGVYDIILIGGGGGGSVANPVSASTNTGGGSGAVTKIYSAELDGTYSISVGAAGSGNTASGTNGGLTMMYKSDFTFMKTATGGYASSQLKKIGRGGGIGGEDSVYGDGTVSFGRGGDNEYGRGVRGSALTDDVTAAQGYGAGGWGTFAPTGGAVFIYGYVGV